MDKADAQLTLAAATSPGTLASSDYQHQQVELDLYLERGRVKLQRGQLAAAADAFKRVLAMNPDQGPANRDPAGNTLEGFIAPTAPA